MRFGKATRPDKSLLFAARHVSFFRQTWFERFVVVVIGLAATSRASSAGGRQWLSHTHEVVFLPDVSMFIFLPRARQARIDK